MLKRIYYWFHRKTSKPQEQGEYSAGHWQNAVRAHVLDLCRDARGKVLEVGCGEGLFLVQLAKARPDIEIYGIDKWQDILKKAEERIEKEQIKNVIVSLADASSLSFQDGYFDVVVCINVLFNLPSWGIAEKALGEMIRVCSNDGTVVFDIRNSLNPLLWIKYKLARYYDETVKNLPLKTYRLKEIKTLLKDNGFVIVSRKDIGFPKGLLASIFVVAAKRK